MKAVILFAYTFAASAQIIATINRLPSGIEEVRIRNNSTTTLESFAVVVSQSPISRASSRAPYVVFSDALIETEAKPLLANEERVVLSKGFRGPDKVPKQLLQEPIVVAGIFSGGAATGDPALLSRLLLRRSNMLMAVETSIETLIDAGRRNIPREHLIKQFRGMADAVNRWYIGPEQQIVRSVYQSMIAKLMSLPVPELGSPFPPSLFVEQETAALNRQRVALVESQPSLLDATLISAHVWP